MGFVQCGASARESVVLKNALRSIRKFMESLAGDMRASNNAWRKYTFMNKNNDVEFLPNLLLQPLKDEMDFLEKMIETQLFMSYVEWQVKTDPFNKIDDENMIDDGSTEAAKLKIATLVSKFWKRRLRLRKNVEMSTAR